jgi:hypothetical protein
MTTLREWFFATQLPEWAKKDIGGRLWYGVATLFDMLSDEQLRAASAGLIASPLSADDALPPVAQERGGLSRYPGETAEQHRNRLIHAAELWDYAGADQSIEQQLEYVGFPGAEVVFYSDRIGPRGEPAPYYSQFWIRIPLATLQAREDWTNAPTWGNFVWGYWWWGSGALSVADALLIAGIIAKFKPVNCVCRGVEIGT